MEDSMILLRENWREIDVYESTEDPIKEKIKKIVVNQTGAVLLSGDRGSGKTSIVRKIESELSKENQARFIWINALNINPEETELGALHILKYIVEELDRCNLPETSVLKKIKNDLYLSEKLITSNEEVNLGLDASLTQPNLVIKSSSDLQKKWLGFSTIQLSSMLTNYLKVIEERWSKSTWNKFLYHISQLSNKVRLFAKYFFKDPTTQLVFVFDELDKYNNTKVLELIKQFKNLFNTSKATFIFITDPSVYRLVNTTTSAFTTHKDTNGLEFDLSRTVFTEQIYLKRIKRESLLGYLQTIAPIENKNKYIHEYLIFKAKGNIFNLKRELSKILYIHDKLEYLDIRDIEINSKIIKSLSILQQFAQLVINIYEVGNLYENEVRELALFEILDDFMDYYLSSPDDRSMWNLVGSNLSNHGKTEKRLVTEYKKDLVFAIANALRKNDFNKIPWEAWEGDKPGIWSDVASGISEIKKVKTLGLGRKELAIKAETEEFIADFTQTFGIEITDKNVDEHGVLNSEQRDQLLEVKNELEKPLTKRTLQKIFQVQNLIQDAKGKLEAFWRYRGNILLRRDSAFVVYERRDDLIKLTADTANQDNLTNKLYLHRLRNQEFEITFKIKATTKNSIFNILLYDSENYDNDQANSFYIVRLNSQTPTSQNIRNGILRKDVNQPVNTAHFVKTPSKYSNLQDQILYEVKIKKEKSKVILFVKKLGPKSRFTKIEELDLSNNLYHIVLSNELGEIEITDINLEYK